jgi:hypothetical protein
MIALKYEIAGEVPGVVGKMDRGMGHNHYGADMVACCDADVG